MQLIIDDMRDGYHKVVAKVKADGFPSAPRGEPTREILGAHVILTNPADALPTGCSRKINPAIAAAEAAQLIAGEEFPSLMTRITPHFRDYMDGEVFHGGYPHRASAQYWAVVDRLRKDPESRRAFISFWDPARDLYEDDKHNYPCTTSIQFTVRRGRLDAFVNMRANDVIHGFAYDVFTFTQLQHSIALELGVGVGTYYHYASSLHLYERDVPAAVEMLNDLGPYPEPQLDARGLSRHEARKILRGEQPDHREIGAPGKSIRWYQSKLARFV